MSGGFVSLIGAGPGDPGLITVRGRRAIERADVVLYDYLASPALLASVDVPGQERICVGKRARRHRLSQDGINQLVVKRALAGDRVARLKGGDPFVYGRGAEEAEACAAVGVPFEIVPGVSSSVAAAAYAGIPVTHRDAASCFTVVTGHERADAETMRVDFAELARTGGTLVVLMGVVQVGRWSSGLMAGGLAPDTPVALVRWGTTPRQRTRITTLGDVAEVVADEELRPPLIAVVGEVVRWHDRGLSWFEPRPLAGHVVGVTRPRPRDIEAFQALEDLGAHVVPVPLTRQEPVEDGRPLVDAVAQGGYTDLVFTSANGVKAFARALQAAGRDVRSLHGVRTWAVGPGTARAMRKVLALAADMVPERATGEGLVALAAEEQVGGRTFLFPAAEAAREVVPRGLRQLGATVLQVAAYRTIADPLAAARLESALEQGLSLVTVAAPSACDALMDALSSLGEPPDRIPVATIGPTTDAHARARGLTVAVTAETHTMAGLAEAISVHAVELARAPGDG